mgnify:CR=1 FL=1
MILAAGYLLCMFERIVFGEVSDFLAGLGDHLTDMTPVEILTLVPLGALVVDLRRPAGPAARPRLGHGDRDARRGHRRRADRDPDRASSSACCRSCIVARRSPGSPGSLPPRRGDGRSSRGRRGRPLSCQDLVIDQPARRRPS